MLRAGEAWVPTEKILGYLLDLGHPVGRFKARVFRSLGYDEANAGGLATQLAEIGRSQEVIKSESTPHGMKYVVDGVLKTPIGVDSKIRTVWIIEGNQGPRFVTAYPG